MKKLLIIMMFILFIFNRDNVILTGLNAFNIWSKNLFPIIFPSLMISDLILSTNIIYYLLKHLEKIFNKIFKTNSYFIYIFIISLIAGTPTNIKSIYNNNQLTNDETNKILASVILFNPLFVIKYCSLKIYIIIAISNIIILFINRNNYSKYNNSYITNTSFNLNNSVETNIKILLNILGILTIFMCLNSIIPTNNIYITTLIGGLLEVTNGINKVNYFINDLFLKDILYLLFLSFGGISIFFQIKSILKDTSINYKYYFYNRFLVFICSFIILCMV